MSSIVAVMLAAVGSRAAHASETDAVQRARFAQEFPHAFSLSERAEVALAAGNLDDAGTLYERARDAAPKSGVPVRGACRVALARSDKSARDLCRLAFLMGGNVVEDMRNEVAALVLDKTPPTMDDLSLATFLADGAVRVAPDEAWGYLARCDLAKRLNDRDLLDACLADLARVAPGREGILRAGRQGLAHVSLWIWMGRLFVLLAFAVTLGRYLGRSWRSRRRGVGLPNAAAFMILLGAVVACPRAALAEPSPDGQRMSSIRIDDENPEASVPEPAEQLKNPLEFGYLLQDLLGKALDAEKRHDYYHEARYYRSLAKAVPQRAYAFGKLCEALQSLGERDNALIACRAALSRQDVTATEYSRFVYLMLSKTDPLSAAELHELDEVVDHVAKDPEARTLPHNLRCQIGLRIHSQVRLEQCTSALAELDPDSAATLSFEWALALEKGDRDGARRLMKRARTSGMSDEGLGRMEQAMRVTFGVDKSRIALWALVAVLCGLAAWAATKRFRPVQQRRVIT